MTTAVERPALTLYQVVHDPLDTLLAAVRATVHTAAFGPAGPLGVAIEPDDRIVLVVRDGFEGEARECLVRGMLASLLRLDTSAWPPQIRFETHATEERPGRLGVLAEDSSR